MNLLTDASVWTTHQPPKYAEIQHALDQGRAQAAADYCRQIAADHTRLLQEQITDHRTAPAAPVIKVGDCLIDTDCRPGETGTVDLPEDEPVEDDEHWIDGFDDLPDYAQDGWDR